MSASAAAIGKIESEQPLAPLPWTTIRAGREYIDRTSRSNIDASTCNDVIKTVLKILSSYPSLFKKGNSKDALREIFGKIKALQSLPVTAEYRLLSRIIEHRFINVISSDERSVQFFSPAFVLQSKMLNAEWGSDMKVGVPNAAYGELSSEEIKCIKDFMDDPNSTPDSVEELLQHISFFDYFGMEDLLTRSRQSLLERIDSLPANSLEQIRGVVTALNSFHVQNSLDLRATLEKRISDFCLEFITKPTSSEIDAFATKIAQLENPITLDFRNSEITDSDLLFLGRFPEIIKGLDLSNCRALTSECVNTLSLFPNLTDLILYNNSFVTDEFVVNLPTTLRVLSLSSNKRVTDASAECFELMTELKELWLSNTSVGDKTVQHLPRGLVSLILSYNQGVTDASAEALGKMRELKVLSLTDTSVGDKTVQHLPRGLVSLNLSLNQKVTDTSAEAWGKMTELRSLYLCNTRVGDKTVQHLPRGLKWLHFYGNRGVTDASAEYFEQMTELETLQLTDTGMSANEAKRLSEEADARVR